MKTHFEISYFPLSEDYKAEIVSFITKAEKKLEDCEINTSSTSTHIKGDYDLIMNFLSKEMKKRLAKGGKKFFTFKVMGK